MQALVGDITLEYDTFGSPDHPTVLLVMGLATQMIAWHSDFCQMIADRGFHVARFDNRDIGLSSKHDGAFSGITSLASAARLRWSGNAPYLLSHMASDGVGLLDHLGIERAHIVGASMGGMIAQQMAIDYPQRLLSMTSIMSTTGSLFAGRSSPEARKLLFRSPATDRAGVVAASLETRRALSPHHFDEEESRLWAEISYDRSHYPEGAARQLAAIFASGNRTKALRDVRVPTLVIHGEADPLVNISGGRATARAIPGAQLKTYETMGHDLPRQLWPDLANDIAAHAEAATAISNP